MQFASKQENLLGDFKGKRKLPDPALFRYLIEIREMARARARRGRAVRVSGSRTWIYSCTLGEALSVVASR